MTKAQIDLEMRPATPADAAAVSDLETVRHPDDPADPAMVRFWWTTMPTDEVYVRQMAERDGAAIAYVMARHRPWTDGAQRFGTTRILLHPKLWSDEGYGNLVDIAELWLRDQGAGIAVIRVRANFTDEIRVLQARGYGEVRRGRQWELDLGANRARLLAAGEQSRKRMEEQGVSLLTLDQDDDPDRLAKLYAISVEAD